MKKSQYHYHTVSQVSALLRCGEQITESNKDFFVTANTLNKPSDHTLTTLFTGKPAMLNFDYA